MKKPFINIKESEGLKENKDSPFYGRFRLEFNQVFSFREPLYFI